MTWKVFAQKVMGTHYSKCPKKFREIGNGFCLQG
jgi:hypothetical protein